MGFAGLTALMAMTDDLLSYFFSKAAIKNKILSQEFIGQMILFYFIGILYNTAFQVKYIFKSIVQHISAGFLAPDTSGAIHDDVLILLFFEHIYCHGQLLTKCITGYFYGIFKMPHFIFIMIAHVNNYGIGIFCQFIKSRGIYVFAFF